MTSPISMSEHINRSETPTWTPAPSSTPTTPKINSKIVYCDCKTKTGEHKPAVLQKSKKPGSNQGREFYACGRIGAACDVYIWSDELKTASQCKCPGIGRALRHVTKNEGRPFYSCKSCKTFYWDEDWKPAEVNLPCNTILRAA
jgi:hypothetical protein